MKSSHHSYAFSATIMTRVQLKCVNIFLLFQMVAEQAMASSNQRAAMLVIAMASSDQRPAMLVIMQWACLEERRSQHPALLLSRSAETFAAATKEKERFTCKAHFGTVTSSRRLPAMVEKTCSSWLRLHTTRPSPSSPPLSGTGHIISNPKRSTRAVFLQMAQPTSPPTSTGRARAKRLRPRPPSPRVSGQLGLRPSPRSPRRAPSKSLYGSTPSRASFSPRPADPRFFFRPAPAPPWPPAPPLPRRRAAAAVLLFRRAAAPVRCTAPRRRCSTPAAAMVEASRTLTCSVLRQSPSAAKMRLM